MPYSPVNFQDGITPLNAETLNRLDDAIEELDARPIGGGSAFGEWSFNATVAEPPGSGQVRLDHANQTLATKIWVHEITATGVDAEVFLMQSKPPDVIYIQDKDDSTRWQEYKLTGPAIDRTTYMELPVVWSAGGLTVPEQRILFTIFHAPAPPDLSVYQLRSEEGQANGYASLDATGKVPAGQLNVAPLPGRLGTAALQHTDWNTAVDNGWYMAAGAANAPDPTNWFIGEVVQHNASWVTQTVWRFTDGLYRYRYRRQLTTGGWSGWVSDPIAYRGTWAAGVVYASGDVVLYGGRYWMAINNNTSVTPV